MIRGKSLKKAMASSMTMNSDGDEPKKKKEYKRVTVEDIDRKIEDIDRNAEQNISRRKKTLETLKGRGISTTKENVSKYEESIKKTGKPPKGYY